MTTFLFMFFRDSVSGAPAFSATAVAGGGFAYRPLMSMGMGS